MKTFFTTLFITLAALISSAVIANESEPSIQLETDDGFSKTLTLSILNSLPTKTMTTTTPWTKESATYSGPSLKDALNYFPHGYKSIEVYAINNYYTSIDAEVIEQHDFMLVTHKDGNTISVRNKGPFWILMDYTKYPQYNQDLELQKTNVWQINKIKANY